MRLKTTGLWAVLATVMMWTSSVRAEAEKVPLDKLPKAVTESLKAKFPDARLKSATKEAIESKTIFKVALEFKEHDHDVSLSPEGKITEIRKTVISREVPDKVARALIEKYPRGTNRSMAEVTRDKTITYEVLLVTADKRLLDVEIAADGKILKETERKEEKEP